MLQYLCLVYADDAALAVADSPAAAAEIAEFSGTLQRKRQLLVSGGLPPSNGATTLTISHGALAVSDHSALAPGQSQPVGFFLIRARDLNDAIRIAADIPAARWGRVEIRQTRTAALPT
ncbi:MAG: YciI family protein [Gammaproteobacteria bacterium]|nr:YciI family protein [Gammaproteobacteria bacterium]